ncbi:conserved hypothetical protein [uncultured Sporomusa sp.]|uniref:Uncharacterized protein n=1 Tax=uncultured Sporomusa sp. TaxID=307249 RepID=A0A212LXW7_9FIRM|nr:conserved hypothetical protein [uncultured Sporomusa sp.]
MAEIIIKLPRCLLVLTEPEILALLKTNPGIWAQALKRGKGLSRFEKSMERRG